MAVVYCAGLCAECREPVLLMLRIEESNLFALQECIEKDNKLYQGEEPELLKTFPEPRRPWTHSSLPEKVGAAFADLQRMLWQNLTPAYIVAGCRSVLEVSCKELGGEGKFLVHRIADLKNKGIVTGVLNEWASQIKNLGNDAAHELEGTRDEAEEMVDFTQTFLQYAFELPARIDELRRNREERLKTP